MKVVILAGGFGTRISEETDKKPKPMIHIGNKPILWHIMKIYASQGFKDFVILLGYKGEMIKDYFLNYNYYNSNLRINLANEQKEIIDKNPDDWKVTLVDTGENTMTGGRIKKAKKYIGNDKFFLTYGDGLSNVNLKNLIKFHESNNSIATMTGVQLQGRFGALEFDNNKITNFKNRNNLLKNFREKSKKDNSWINGGFFICENSIFNFIKNDQTTFEQEPLQKLAKKKRLFVYKHKNFWHPMDNISDHQFLNKLWDTKKAPWKIW